METEINLDKVADNVAEILGTREDAHNSRMVLVGEVALVLGAAYVGTRLIQNVILRRRVRKFLKTT